MTEPERLFSSDPDLSRLREILEAEEPPEGARAEVAERVFASSREWEAAASPAPAVAASRNWVVLGIGLVAAAAIGVASVSGSRSGATPPPAATGAAPPQSETGEPRSEPTPTTPSLPSVRVEDLPAVRTPTAPPSKAPIGDAFLEELALVERARVAIASGRGSECLEVVTSYDKRFASKGLLHEEVEVMRIEALAMTGQRAEARARGERFLEHHRDTPYTERVERVLGRGE